MSSIRETILELITGVKEVMAFKLFVQPQYKLVHIMSSEDLSQASGDLLLQPSVIFKGESLHSFVPNLTFSSDAVHSYTK